MLRWIALSLVLSLVPGGLMASPHPDGAASRPTRVLITNDNGIDDPKIAALARAFARRAETWVVAPDQDRSGTGSHLSIFARGGVVAEPRDLGQGIHAFAVDGYPADCVVLALAGLMVERPPDLIVSGINGGANLGSDWMFSGTVGAARVAAFAGLPALAVSGLDDGLPGAVEAAVDWVVRLAESEVVKGLRPGEYLTVSLPRVAPAEIRGVRITDRAPLRGGPRLGPDDDRVWRPVGLSANGVGIPDDSDQAAHDAGIIAVVPMRVDEVDLERLARWRRFGVGLPEWRPAAEARPEED